MDHPTEPLILMTSDPKDAIVLNVHHSTVLSKGRKKHFRPEWNGLPGNQIKGITYAYH